MQRINMSGNSLQSRVVSGFPLSIGTGLAFESLFIPTQAVYDLTRETPAPLNLQQYDECWINLSTLFRNLVGSIDKQIFPGVTVEEFKDTLLEEIDVIRELFQNDLVSRSCIPVFYVMKYDKAKRNAPPQVKFREDNTPVQKHYAHVHDEVMKAITKDNDAIRSFDSEIKTQMRTSAIIMTHMPYDLLSVQEFNKLTLLESHTGKSKGKNLWYTKYYPVGKRSMSNLPFLRKLLLVFGDHVLISPGIYKLREQILDTAEKRQWTPMSTESKVMMDLGYEIREPLVMDFLRAL